MFKYHIMFQTKVGSVFMSLDERNRSSIGYTEESKEIFGQVVRRPIMPGPKPPPSKIKIENMKRTLPIEAAKVVQRENQLKPYLQQKAQSESIDAKIKRLMLADLIDKQRKRNLEIKAQQQKGLITRQQAKESQVKPEDIEPLLRQAAQVLPVETGTRVLNSLDSTADLNLDMEAFDAFSATVASQLRESDDRTLDVLNQNGPLGPRLGMSDASQEGLERTEQERISMERARRELDENVRRGLAAEESKEQEGNDFTQEEFERLTPEQLVAFREAVESGDSLRVRRFIDKRREQWARADGGAAASSTRSKADENRQVRELYVSMGGSPRGKYIGGTEALLRQVVRGEITVEQLPRDMFESIREQTSGETPERVQVRRRRPGRR